MIYALAVASTNHLHACTCTVNMDGRVRVTREIIVNWRDTNIRRRYLNAHSFGSLTSKHLLSFYRAVGETVEFRPLIMIGIVLWTKCSTRTNKCG